jgi:hypothetical protein
MSLRSIQLANFKSFGPTPQEIPLKPLTLIFGPNSAGKSSIIHSLLWLNHFLGTGETDVRHPAAAKGKIDLGGFRKILHRHDDTVRFLVELKFSPDILPSSERNWWNIEDEISIDVSFGRPPGGDEMAFCLLDYRLKVDGEDFIRAVRKKNHLTVTSIGLDHSAIIQRVLLLAGNDRGGASKSVRSLAELENTTTEELEAAILAEADLLNELAEETGVASEAVAVHYALTGTGQLPSALVRLSEPEGEEFYDSIFPKRVSALLRATSEACSRQVGGLQYVPPLRDLPPRFFDLSLADKAWQRLFGDPAVRERISDWLGGDSQSTKYELEVTEYYPRHELERDLPSILQQELGEVTADPGDFGSPSFVEELGEVLADLTEAFPGPDAKKLLMEHPDILKYVEQFQYDYFSNEMHLSDYDDTDFVFDPVDSERTWDDLTEGEKRAFVRENLMVDVHISSNELEDGHHAATELFKRFAASHPALVELIERHGDQAARSTQFLDDISKQSQNVRREITLRDVRANTRVALQDVGVGISQVIPVLLECFSQKGELIAIEQPEIHIHPALQAELGDVFLESALGVSQNCFVLETHSEHLILRLLRRIRETTDGEIDDWPESLRNACPNGITPDQIAVLYVEPSEAGSQVRELRINDLGEFIDEWPNGFFEERIGEVF